MLQGTVVDREENLICLMTAGVGHEVLCTLNALASVSTSINASAEVRLWTHLVVREDILQLFGFADKKERTLFRELIRISGVGPKVALSILSGMDVSGLVRAINQGDAVILTKLPGIGKKTAERLVIEMSDRLVGWEVETDSSSMLVESEKIDLADEAEAALISLGYKPADAAKMLISVKSSDDMSVENLIRAALQSRLRS